MIEFRGKYSTAKVMIDEIDQLTSSQIVSFLNHPAFTNPVVIMPDCHAGKGAVIGFTMPLGEAVVPSTIGVDISCGMRSYKLSRDSFLGFSWETLDKEIRDIIPFGFEVREKDPYHRDGGMEKAFPWRKANLISRNFCYRYNKRFPEKMKPTEYTYKWFMEKCEQIELSPTRAIRSLGTLGGGNHFIELGKDSGGYIWLTIHSGSRQFGKCICDYWQSTPARRKAAEIQQKFQDGLAEIKRTHSNTKSERQQIPGLIKKLKTDLGMNNKVAGSLDYLTGEDKHGYLTDMIFTSVYAYENRKLIGRDILELARHLLILDAVETVHNYIDFSDFIIRKGAVSAQAKKRVIIPFNMEDGILLCEGKGNPDWNYSAPHGAGRLFSRAKAKEKFNASTAMKRMITNGIYTSTVPVDEVKEAYKDPEVIINAITPTVDILDKLKPVMNLKEGN